MVELVFATNNLHKIEEVRHLLDGRKNIGHHYIISGLNEIGCTQDIPETGDTLEANALQKAEYILKHYGRNCFSDDTGLEIDALNGRPGVYSARYAGGNKSFEDNMNKVLLEMDGITNRRARFRTVVCLILHGRSYFFEGIVEGVITTTKSGQFGFGYDPIFRPDGYTQSFAEMDLAVKNRISHRAKAFARLIDFLTNDALKS